MLDYTIHSFTSMGYLWNLDPFNIWIMCDYKGAVLHLANTLMDNATVSVKHTLFEDYNDTNIYILILYVMIHCKYIIYVHNASKEY